MRSSINILKYKFLATINPSAWIYQSSSMNRNGRSNQLQSNKQNTKASLKTATAVCVCACVLSFISSRPASLSHSISWLRQNASGTSSKQREACVQATHHRSCVVVSGEEPPSVTSNLQWQAYPPLLIQTAPLTEAATTQTHTRPAIHTQRRNLKWTTAIGK